MDKLKGKKIYLRPFTKKDITKNYLFWLNDKETNRYSRRRFYKTTKQQALDYFLSFKKNSAFLAIISKENKEHIGNITITITDKYNNIAEVAILIGNKNYWGKGYGKDAWQTATRYAFEKMRIRKLTAGTFNPAMERILKSQKWIQEGLLKNEFEIKKGVYLDKPLYRLLKKEYDSLRKTDN